MAIVVGLDVHRVQITYDALNTATGEVATGRITPADRPTPRGFLPAGRARTSGPRWRRPPAGGSSSRSCSAPAPGCSWPSRQTRRQRAARSGAPRPTSATPATCATCARAAAAAGLDRARAHPRAARPGAAAQDARRPAHRVAAAHPRRALPSRRPPLGQPARWPRRPPGACRAGPLVGRATPDHRRAGGHRARQLPARPTRPRPQGLRARSARLPGADAPLRHRPQVACAMLAELGDTRRFSSSRQSVRLAGLDVTVHESDTKRRAGHLSRQGHRSCAGRRSKPPSPPASRPRPTTPTTKRRVGANRAVLSIARKLLRRAHHTLPELGDDALAPAA